jgi:hypothetical protein
MGWVIGTTAARWRVRAPTLAALAALALVTLAEIAPPARAARHRPVVAFDLRRPGAAVPTDFLGLSFEVSSLPLMASYADRGDLVGLLRSLGPGLIRFGGVTADTQAAWIGEDRPLPDWATVGLGPPDFAALARLVAQTGWQVLLTLNLGHYDPQAAADEAAAAHGALGSALTGLAFGNEPDAFASHQQRPQPWDFPTYAQQVLAYRQALAPAEAALPLVGPDASTGRDRLAWARDEAGPVAVAALTAHFYPLSACRGSMPRISDMLSRGIRGLENQRLAEMIAVSRSSGRPLRIDEANDVSCGGQPGVSNTFASALWAVDFLARAMAAGVAGVNFHGNVGLPLGYAPFAADNPSALGAGQLTAHPEWYALLLARQLLGGRPLPTRALAAGSALSAQAFAMPTGAVRVVLVDERASYAAPRAVRLRLPASLAAASVLRLTGPSLSATSGATLGGSAVAADGSWSPAGPGRLLVERHRAVTLSMPAASAALVTLYPQH